MKTDIEIASEIELKKISEIAEKLGLTDDEYVSYGKHVGKIELSVLKTRKEKAKMVLVTAMTPTPAGEGKTTVSTGLNEALNRIGKNSLLTLREPSLGPLFGVKGGATGGGYSQVLPMADINLHFTGDIHAVGAAHNLLASLFDNHYSRTDANSLLPRTDLWHRVMDMNDRSLRNVVLGLGLTSGKVRESKFEITAASEVMAILALSKDLDDLKKRLGNIIIAENYDGNPIFAKDLKAENAMTILLKDAIKPNLVQTIEGNPVLIHAGPFANIAHGTSSLIAMRMAKRLADIVVIEAGFASDLGAEKFFNIVSREEGITPPDTVVIVATVRALKYHGGVKKNDLLKEDLSAIEKGFPNLQKHIENMLAFKRPVHVAINSFTSDTEQEIELVKKLIEQTGVMGFVTDVWAKGGLGAVELAQAVYESSMRDHNDVKYVYEMEDPIEEKIKKVATRIYGADGISIRKKARTKIAKIEKWGYGNLPICMAKTQASLSDDPKLKGRPAGFITEIRDIKVSGGAEFIVVYTAQVMTMPGLPKVPAAELMDIDTHGNISGLF